jgi:lysophospholipase L1-like esterase
MITYFLGQNNTSHSRVACIGDSLTQFSEYPYVLTNKLGDNYTIRNFGVSATTVALDSATPYMDTTEFQEALRFNPNIVIIMLGTNDARPDHFQYNNTFIDNYITLIHAFQKLPSNPKIWIVLPPPVFNNRTWSINPEYFEQTIIPNIKQVANKTNLPLIDVYTLLIDHPEYFPDGLHPKETTNNNKGNEPAAQIIATAIHKAITTPP